MTAPDNTPSRTLLRAADIGREAGLRYVYAGNIPGRVEDYEDTRCPNCNRSLIQRMGYLIRAYHISAQGACPHCGTPIAGVWPEHPAQHPSINSHRPGVLPGGQRLLGRRG